MPKRYWASATTSGYRVFKPVGRGILAGRRRKFLIQPRFQTTPQSHQKTKFSTMQISQHGSANCPQNRKLTSLVAKSPHLLAYSIGTLQGPDRATRKAACTPRSTCAIYRNTSRITRTGRNALKQTQAGK